jgi:hypothetical protein
MKDLKDLKYCPFTSPRYAAEPGPIVLNIHSESGNTEMKTIGSRLNPIPGRREQCVEHLAKAYRDEER